MVLLNGAWVIVIDDGCSLLYFVILCYTLLYFVIPCYALLCFVMFCYALLCFVMLCYPITLGYVIPSALGSGSLQSYVKPDQTGCVMQGPY